MKRPLYTFVVAALAASGWLSSGAIHEIGHAVVAKAAGLDIVHMQPWAFFGRVHVRFAGETTRSWYAAINISGMLLTVLVGLFGGLAAILSSRRWPAAWLSVFFFIPMMCQCLAWFGLPLAIMLGAKAPGDDVTKFMQQTGWHALAVSAIGLALAVPCGAVLMWLFRRRGANQAVEATS